MNMTTDTTDYKTLKTEQLKGALCLTIHRPEARNSINEQLLTDINEALNSVEHNPDIRCIILRGENNLFCMGMDFKAVADANRAQTDAKPMESSEYIKLLRRFSTIPKIIIAEVDGTVMAGGMGIVAASDLVITTPQSQFSLSEALWGLLPCCVLPYLIRRIGFQAAYRLTLTTQTINGEAAYRLQLADELTENPMDNIRRLLLRLNRLETQTLKDMKAYFRKMWIIDEEMEQIAVNETTRLTQTERVQQNIANFVQHQRFPWDKTD